MSSTLRHRLNSPWIVMALVALAYLVFIVKHRIAFHGDLSCFIVAGSSICDARQTPSNLTVYPGDGYDGQYYYRLALNPFTHRHTEFGIKIGQPSYRQQRILLPLLAWLLSFGQASAVPFCIVLINWLALCSIGWLAGASAMQFGRHALWGLPLALYPGFILSLSRSTPELVEIAFLLLSLLLLKAKRPAWATLALMLAVLGKETALLVAIGALISFAWGRWKGHKDRYPPPIYALLPLALGVLWQCALFVWWGRFPSLAGKGNVGLPFLALIPFYLSTVAMDSIWRRVWFLEMTLLAAYVVCILQTIRKLAAEPYLTTIWALYALQAVCLTRLVWVEDMSFLRTLSEFWVLGSLLLLPSGRRTRLLVAAFTALLWLVQLRLRVPII